MRRILVGVQVATRNGIRRLEPAHGSADPGDRPNGAGRGTGPAHREVSRAREGHVRGVGQPVKVGSAATAVAAVAAGTVVAVHAGSTVVGAAVVAGAVVVVGATEVVVLLDVVVTAALMMRSAGGGRVVVVVLVLVLVVVELVVGATVVVVLVLVVVVQGVAAGVPATHVMSADACSAVPLRTKPAMMVSAPTPKVSG